MTLTQKVVLEIMKATMKPGYLYGIGEDGEIYCIEAPTPKKGMTLYSFLAQKPCE